jgi:hypothetical protein
MVEFHLEKSEALVSKAQTMVGGAWILRLIDVSRLNNFLTVTAWPSLFAVGKLFILTLLFAIN